MLKGLVVTLILGWSSVVGQQKLLIYMDLQQTDHLKAYGIAYWVLTRGMEVDWLLNYRGGSFMVDNMENIAAECRIRGVAFTGLTAADAAQIYA